MKCETCNGKGEVEPEKMIELPETLVLKILGKLFHSDMNNFSCNFEVFEILEIAGGNPLIKEYVKREGFMHGPSKTVNDILRDPPKTEYDENESKKLEEAREYLKMMLGIK